MIHGRMPYESGTAAAQGGTASGISSLKDAAYKRAAGAW